MSQRQERRAAEHQARKLAYKSAKSATTTTATKNVTSVASSPNPIPNVPEPGIPFPSLAAISPARLEANRANAQQSTGPITEQGKAASAQNRTTHGLARHNGAFKILPTENSAAFESLKQSLLEEYQPATPTEEILIGDMAESRWLIQRAQRIQSLWMDPETGQATDASQFALYLRYENTHRRVFEKALNTLLKLRAEKRKAQVGFEARTGKSEQHEMKKDKHYWDVLKKDAETCAEISRTAYQNVKFAAECPGFEAQYAAELAKKGLTEGISRVAIAA